jgi:hypothetical protein
LTRRENSFKYKNKPPFTTGLEQKMEIKETRLTNFMTLASGYPKIVDFCDAIQMAPSYFSQVKRGQKMIGDDRARQIEEALSLPLGWMDMPHDQSAEPQRLPSDELGVAYALASLPEAIKQRIKSLVYDLAADYASRTPSSSHGTSRSPTRSKRQEPADDEDGSTAAKLVRADLFAV